VTTDPRLALLHRAWAEWPRQPLCWGDYLATLDPIDQEVLPLYGLVYHGDTMHLWEALEVAHRLRRGAARKHVERCMHLLTLTPLTYVTLGSGIGEVFIRYYERAREKAARRKLEASEAQAQADSEFEEHQALISSWAESESPTTNP
jgi:hypothetical protein